MAKKGFPPQTPKNGLIFEIGHLTTVDVTIYNIDILFCRPYCCDGKELGIAQKSYILARSKNDKRHRSFEH